MGIKRILPGSGSSAVWKVLYKMVQLIHLGSGSRLGPGYSQCEYTIKLNRSIGTTLTFYQLSNKLKITVITCWLENCCCVK